ncbi:HNH nuclease [Vibrio phage 2.275.O._10N.286.54.E11]|nr:HNH nuclease [Vibrio phage 2.275.O._10N.286.54.E11]
MNYKKHYDAMINRAKNRILEGYSEKHHIIPKCMGGDNSKSNLVALTGREHFVAHQLLIKIYPEQHGLAKAAMLMAAISPTHSGRSKNRLYGWLKEKLSKEMSETQNGENGDGWIIKDNFFFSLTEAHVATGIRLATIQKYTDPVTRWFNEIEYIKNKNKRTSFSVKVYGVTYKTLKDATAATGHNSRTLKRCSINGVFDPNLLKRSSRSPSSKKIQVIINGCVYKSRSEASRTTGIDYGTLKKYTNKDTSVFDVTAYRAGCNKSGKHIPKL